MQTIPSLKFPIIAHCHLGWDWVWQRPQQFLSRLSADHRILFVEMQAPSSTLSFPRTIIRPTNWPNLTVLQMQFPSAVWGDGEYVDWERRRLLREALRVNFPGEFNHPLQWFYDPMAVTAFAGHMDECAIVYDCMDEHSQFRGAPPVMIERERELLKRANVVFTGGRRLYESKRKQNANCFFYGCGVDVPHFARAQAAETKVPEDIKHISHPILGYFGVVDERLDYELIAQLADANRAWNVVIVGPAAKVDPKSFPRRENLFWMGGRGYDQLPAYAKAFDACLMPFALNAATEFINPTKALEYMATGRPIISTAVPDVVSNFASAVKIGLSPDEFIALCEQQIAQRDGEMVRRGMKMAEENSWESILAKMEKNIADALVLRAPVNINETDRRGREAQMMRSSLV